MHGMINCDLNKMRDIVFLLTNVLDDSFDKMNYHVESVSFEFVKRRYIVCSASLRKGDSNITIELTCGSFHVSDVDNDSPASTEVSIYRSTDETSFDFVIDMNAENEVIWCEMNSFVHRNAYDLWQFLQND